jgi:hypothetical protein
VIRETGNGRSSLQAAPILSSVPFIVMAAVRIPGIREIPQRTRYGATRALGGAVSE